MWVRDPASRARIGARPATSESETIEDEELPGLQRDALRAAVGRFERSRASRRGLGLEQPRKRRCRDEGNIVAAFERAEREQRELRRLRESGRPFPGLDFHPERLSETADTTTDTTTAKEQ